MWRYYCVTVSLLIMELLSLSFSLTAVPEDQTQTEKPGLRILCGLSNWYYTQTHTQFSRTLRVSVQQIFAEWWNSWWKCDINRCVCGRRTAWTTRYSLDLSHSADWSKEFILLTFIEKIKNFVFFFCKIWRVGENLWNITMMIMIMTAFKIVKWTLFSLLFV